MLKLDRMLKYLLAVFLVAGISITAIAGTGFIGLKLLSLDLDQALVLFLNPHRYVLIGIADLNGNRESELVLQERFSLNETQDSELFEGIDLDGDSDFDLVILKRANPIRVLGFHHIDNQDSDLELILASEELDLSQSDCRSIDENDDPDIILIGLRDATYLGISQEDDDPNEQEIRISMSLGSLNSLDFDNDEDADLVVEREIATLTYDI